ncbi:serine O-acetyltransferase [Halostella sp. JP-L12]|uniref:serine O-acetyltransferase n=1 Tax=Halostella TaxID=1843185 RepID=UPI000EF81223|nr:MULTISPECIES: serine O-acetyltransferase [Halostella]NHN48640.1 serine O-acetyltransferase [Halostella sp. JP-L12]
MLEGPQEDVRAALERDPAAKSRLEVALCYAGLHAVWFHRIAHALWNRGFRLTARVLSQFSRFLTGVEIHPAAEIGRRLFIDHGAGVVIGETAEVGDDVHMHHGCTLGGNDPRPVKRHPTVEDGVVMGANATLVGDIIVGEDAAIGAGAVVVDDVAPGETMVGVPASPVGGDESAETEESSESGGESSADDGSEVSGEIGTGPVDPDESPVSE